MKERVGERVKKEKTKKSGIVCGQKRKEGECLSLGKTFTVVYIQASLSPKSSIFVFVFLSLSAPSALSPLYSSSSFSFLSFHNTAINSTKKTTMVNWKSADATDRLFASLIAGHPNLRVGAPNPTSRHKP